MRKKRKKSVISFNMSRVRSSGTSIEKRMDCAFKKEKIKGYIKNTSSVFGKPDFSWSKFKIAVFCDSSFWHGYKFLKTSRHRFRSNKKFWIEKIGRNIERDKYVKKALKKQGWKVLRFWDFQIKNDTDKCIRKIWKELKEKSIKS